MLLPQVDDENHRILAGIDPYTIFNGIQMHRFLLEWKDVRAKASAVEERNSSQKSKTSPFAAVTRSTFTSDLSATDRLSHSRVYRTRC
jgi:hypothetical protein